MAVAGSARRYAQAVFRIAREQNAWDQWLADLTELAQLAQDPGFRLIMESPRIPLAKKLELLQDQLVGVGPLATNLAQLLVVKRRVDVIPGLAEEYRRMLDVHRGVEHARVTAAVPLDAAEQRALAQQLEQQTGKQILLETEVDPSILGGLVVRIGDKLLDGSTRAQLEALRRQLAAAE